MFNSIFGALGQQSLYQNNPSALQNGYNQQMSNQLAQQQMAQYNKYAQQRTARWMINGEVFNSAQDFALHLWPDDEEARLMFCLKYPI
jgi:hypothetical protein